MKNYNEWGISKENLLPFPFSLSTLNSEPINSSISLRYQSCFYLLLLLTKDSEEDFK
jgi:hypothetical protein